MGIPNSYLGSRAEILRTYIHIVGFNDDICLYAWDRFLTTDRMNFHARQMKIWEASAK